MNIKNVLLLLVGLTLGFLFACTAPNKVTSPALAQDAQIQEVQPDTMAIEEVHDLKSENGYPRGTSFLLKTGSEKFLVVVGYEGGAAIHKLNDPSKVTSQSWK